MLGARIQQHSWGGGPCGSVTFWYESGSALLSHGTLSGTEASPATQPIYNITGARVQQHSWGGLTDP
jgi:hypothetical protein